MSTTFSDSRLWGKKIDDAIKLAHMLYYNVGGGGDGLLVANIVSGYEYHYLHISQKLAITGQYVTTWTLIELELVSACKMH